MGITVIGTFPSRQAVELAIEYLVQEHGLERTDIFIQPVSGDNTVGVVTSGGDNRDGLVADNIAGTTANAALNGAIEVSIDLNAEKRSAVEKAFKAAGALKIYTK